PLVAALPLFLLTAAGCAGANDASDTGQTGSEAEAVTVDVNRVVLNKSIGGIAPGMTAAKLLGLRGQATVESSPPNKEFNPDGSQVWHYGKTTAWLNGLDTTPAKRH